MAPFLAAARTQSIELLPPPTTTTHILALADARVRELARVHDLALEAVHAFRCWEVRVAFDEYMPVATTTKSNCSTTLDAK